MKDNDPAEVSPGEAVIQISVEAIDCEMSVDPLQFHIDFAIDKATKSTSSFNSQAVIPLSQANTYLQLTVRSASPQPESHHLGSVSFTIAELAALKRDVEFKHWVTLFDDEDDNVYDGDYQEDDVDLPRVLISYRIGTEESAAVTHVSERINELEVEDPSAQPGRGISFGPQHFGTEETLGSKKDSEVLLKSPDKNREDLEEIKSGEDNAITPVDASDAVKERVDQNLFTLSENSKEAEISLKGGDNPLIFSRQAIIEDAQQKVPKETQSETYENRGSTVEYAEDTMSEKAPAAKSLLQSEPKIIIEAFRGLPQTAQEDEEEESPRFGTSVESVVPTQTVPVQKVDEYNKGEQNAKELSGQLIEGMNERVKKLKQEMFEIEQEKSNLYVKHQKEIQSFDNEMAMWLKEKHELTTRLASLEYELGLSQQTANQKTQELAQLKEFYENERTLREQEQSMKVTQLEARIRTVQQQAQEYKVKLTTTNNATSIKEEDKDGANAGASKGLAQSVAEIGKGYEEKVRNMHELLLESEAKNSEYCKQLQQSETRAEEAETGLAAIKEENSGLKRELGRLRDELAKVKSLYTEQGSTLVSKEREANRRISELLEENVKLRTQAETYKAMIEGGKAKGSEEAKRIEELEIERNEAVQISQEMREETTKLTEKLGKQAHDFSEEKARLEKRLTDKDQEMAKLKEGLKNLQLEFAKRNNKEEECVRHEKTVKSLQALLEDEKLEREKLLTRLRNLQLEFDALNKEKQQLCFSVASGSSAEVKKPHSSNEENRESQLVLPDESLAESVVESRVNRPVMGSYHKRSERLEDIAKRTVETEKKIEHLKSRGKEEEWRKKDAQQIQELGENYAKLLKQLEELNATLKPKKEENEQLKIMIGKYKREVDSLRSELAEKTSLLNSVVLSNNNRDMPLSSGRSPDNKSSSPSAVASIDKVDRMLVQHMSRVKCPVVVRKLGQGQYIFGTRKIFAKIHNGKLVIRVGGGFMLIDEFLSVYTSHELGKLEKASANNNMSAVELSDPSEIEPDNNPHVNSICLEY